MSLAFSFSNFCYPLGTWVHPRTTNHTFYFYKVTGSPYYSHHVTQNQKAFIPQPSIAEQRHSLCLESVSERGYMINLPADTSYCPVLCFRNRHPVTGDDSQRRRGVCWATVLQTDAIPQMTQNCHHLTGIKPTKRH